MMQKRILILAVAAATAAPAAFADTANVNIYGTVDVALSSTDNGSSAAGVSGTRATQVSSQVSKLGFKGDENLGDGVSAIWQFEQQINVDDSAYNGPTSGVAPAAGTGAIWATRNSYVGLKSSSAGTVLLGRHDTPYKLATRGLDLFADSLADNRTLMGGGAATNGAGLHDARPTDVIAYISPNWSGFGIAAAYVAAAEAAVASTVTKGDAWSIDATYSDGPLYAALAYQTIKYGTAGSGQFTQAAAALVGKTADAWKLGVGYKIDAFQLNAVYEKTSDELNPTGSGADQFGRSDFYVAGSYTFGSDAVKLAYTHAGNQSGAGALDYSASQVSVGYDHNLSKRTKVYALYTQVNNSTNAAYTLSSSGSTAGGFALPGAGADPSAWSFGIKHSF